MNNKHLRSIMNTALPALHEAGCALGRRGLFDDKRLRSMKKGAFLVNVSRGAIVDRQAIVDALEDGHIAGYAGLCMRRKLAGSFNSDLGRFLALW